MVSIVPAYNVIPAESLLADIKPHRLVEYLREIGWKVEEPGRHEYSWTATSPSRFHALKVPVAPVFENYLARLLEVLSALCFAGGRSSGEVLVHLIDLPEGYEWGVDALGSHYAVRRGDG